MRHVKKALLVSTGTLRWQAKTSLRAEIRRLQTELDEMRREREAAEDAARAADKADDDDDDSADYNDLNDQFSELKEALTELKDNASDEIAERPLISVLGAFVVGIVVGRMLEALESAPMDMP